MKPPPHLRARVLADVVRRDEVVAWEPPLRPVLAVLGLACLTRWAIVFLQEISAGGLAHDGPLSWIALVTATATTALVATGRRGMLGPPLARLVAAAAGGLAILVVSPFVMASLTAGTVAASGSSSTIRTPHGDAFVYLGVALLAVAAAWRNDPIPAGARGAALGAAAGLWLSAVCTIACSVTDPWHVVVHHVAFVPALALVVAVVERARRRRASV